MKLHFYTEEKANFGDDINPWFWAKALGLDVHNISAHSSDLILGIGTLINDLLPTDQTIHILGSGAGYGNKVPKQQKNWNVHFVRGPLTAEAIGVDKSKGISDPVILLNRWVPLAEKKRYPFSFMPHYAIDSPKLKSAVARTGMNYISPQMSRDDVILQVNESEKLITSAMHGTILAEALRVPWHPVVTSPEILPFKWKDFLSTLDLEYEPTVLTPIWPEEKTDLISKLKRPIKEIMISNELKKVQKSSKFYLSKLNTLEARQNELEDAISQFKLQYLMS